MTATTKQNQFKFKKLCCVNCAKAIEAELNQLNGLDLVKIDYANKLLMIKSSSNSKRVAIRVNKIVRKYNSKLALTTWHQSFLIEKFSKIALALGTIIFLIGIGWNFSPDIKLVVFLTAYLLTGWQIFLTTGKNILRGKFFDENFLMTLATIGAWMLGEYSEAVAVIVFYQLGEFLQTIAVKKSQASISALMAIRPDYANLKSSTSIKQVKPEEIQIGDLIIVKPGERVPLDGKVVAGESSLDMAALTGESLPQRVSKGDQVLSGSINKNGLLTVKVTKKFADGTVTKILDLVQNASSQKAPTEKFITKFAKIYTPIVVLAAAALAFIPPLIWPDASWAEWINRGLIFLVIACPCALVVSIPLTFFGGIGAASQIGVLIKGSNYLEALNDLQMIVFDKTGTLTKGNFKVTELKPSNNFTAQELLKFAAAAESFSTHPIALSLQTVVGQKNFSVKLFDYQEISGQGIKAQVNGHQVLVGNEKLLVNQNIEFSKQTKVGTVVYVAIDQKFAGYILITDEIRPDSQQTIKLLKKLKLKTALLTGDRRQIAEKVGNLLGVEQIFAELLPQQKVAQLQKLIQQIPPKKKLAFVGDGINDAPVLAQADLGIAMGAGGSDAAIEAADIVIMSDEPAKLISAIKIAKKTHQIAKQNIMLALGIKIIFLLLGALGLATMWQAVFADVGVTLLAIANAARMIMAKYSIFKFSTKNS
ncbi:heavy metal translocating P-type ATPase [Liquorilactobacillus sicerae]|uniref:heavy metal translocating P-type ATPase n=1 Tax=Liquorilactobacillus sicerae TaxID=1416943 RepID=UPI0031F370F4